MKHATRIQEAEAAYTLWWSDIASEAAAEGVEVRPGEAYGIKAVSNAWGELRRVGLVGQPGTVRPAAPVRQIAPALVPPPLPTRSAPAASPGPMNKPGKVEPEKPTYTASSMPQRRRFGDER